MEERTQDLRERLDGINSNLNLIQGGMGKLIEEIKSLFDAYEDEFSWVPAADKRLAFSHRLDILDELRRQRSDFSVLAKNLREQLDNREGITGLKKT